MEFLYYDLTFLVVFCVAVAAFLIKRRKNIRVESKILLLYPTKVGLKLIDSIGSKHKKLFKVMSYVVIVTGYLLMITSIVLFVDFFLTLIKTPALFKAIKVPPIMPIFPYFTNVFKVDYLPPFYFTYWISAIAIIAIVHEFAHGIFARFYGVKVKSTGFGFLGPFIAAFVEPDERQLIRKSNKAQIAVLSAGSFANLMFTLIFLVIMLIFFKTLFVSGGVIFDSYIASKVSINEITTIGNKDVNNLSVKAFLDLVEDLDKNYYDLKMNIDNTSVNFTKITAKNRTFFALADNLIAQAKILEKSTEDDNLVLFDDTPALRAGLWGAINRINSAKINNLNDLKRELAKYKPHEKIIIEVTDIKYNKKNYVVELTEDPKNKSKAVLGIAFELDSATNIKSSVIYYIKKISERVREPHIFYIPSHKTEVVIFIYNLLWWIIFLNLSVALVNMLPLGIFDGGRVFYLTMLSITKSKRKAKTIFQIAIFFILLIMIILTIMWLMNYR